MTDFSIDVGPFNGVVNGVDGGLGDVDDAKVLIIGAADDLLASTKSPELTSAVQRLRDETLTVLAADTKTYIDGAIDSARGARDAYLEFDATAESDADGAGG